MGVVTVTIDDKVEKRFRKKLDELGNKKGKMGEAVSEALDEWLKQQDSGEEEWEKIAEEGASLGNFQFDRKEANER